MKSVKFESNKKIFPSKIIAVGLNYIDHAAELSMPIPKYPVIFLKPPSSILSNNGQIIYPKGVKRLDYEAELAFLIKKTAKNITCNKAKEYILGYTCLNDITARDLQKIDGQWTRSKSFDTFCPVGPRIVNNINPGNLDISLYQNGVLRQKSNTKNMIFNCYELLSFISNIMTLLPGDIITTGTPPGIGPVAVGDTLEVRIEKIGSLVNTISRP